MGESGEEARKVGPGDILPSYLAAKRSGSSKSLDPQIILFKERRLIIRKKGEIGTQHEPMNTSDAEDPTESSGSWNVDGIGHILFRTIIDRVQWQIKCRT